MQLSSLYQKATHHGLFHFDHGFQNGIYPYIIGDKGYPLLPWLVIPHKHNATTKHTLLKAFYNRHIFRGRVVVENVFKILKKKFWNLFLKTNLGIIFIFNVVILLFYVVHSNFRWEGHRCGCFDGLIGTRKWTRSTRCTCKDTRQCWRWWNPWCIFVFKREWKF